MGIEGEAGKATQTDHAEHKGEHEEAMSVTPGISVPKDSNIIGGSNPGEAVDPATASGPSDSGGG